MALIQTVEPEKAEGQAKEIYDPMISDIFEAICRC
jgi:hypothetical protein